jgi:hypothetical protein
MEILLLLRLASFHTNTVHGGKDNELYDFYV